MKEVNVSNKAKGKTVKKNTNNSKPKTEIKINKQGVSYSKTGQHKNKNNQHNKNKKHVNKFQIGDKKMVIQAATPGQLRKATKSLLNSPAFSGKTAAQANLEKMTNAVIAMDTTSAGLQTLGYENEAARFRSANNT